MSRTGTLILIGTLTIVLPFSGLPIAFRSLLSVVFGLIIIGIGLSFRKAEVQSAEPVTE